MTPEGRNEVDVRGEPAPTELIHQLHEALYGVRSPARDDSPKVVWEQLLAEVRRMTSRIPMDQEWYP